MYLYMFMCMYVQETAAQRAAEWRAVTPAVGLVDRRVEITGPSSDRKMVINALNSGATQYMADFEDATTPTWENMIRGQINVRDSLDRSISFEAPDGKKYKLNDKVHLLRPRASPAPAPSPHSSLYFTLYRILMYSLVL